MPKNRRMIDRTQRLTEILDAAATLFQERGYQAATMAQLAHAVGIAQNAIYWYYPSKEHVLVAVLERRHEAVLAALAADEAFGKHLGKTLKTALRVMRELQPLVNVLRARAAHSLVILEFRQRFHTQLRRVVAAALKRTAPTLRNRELLADAVIALVEGALIYESSERPAERVVALAIKRLVRIES